MIEDVTFETPQELRLKKIEIEIDYLKEKMRIICNTLDQLYAAIRDVKIDSSSSPNRFDL